MKKRLNLASIGKESEGKQMVALTRADEQKALAGSGCCERAVEAGACAMFCGLAGSGESNYDFFCDVVE